MKIADYFKAKSDIPIDVLIEEQQGDDVALTLAKCQHDKSDSEIIVDRILKGEDADNNCLSI